MVTAFDRAGQAISMAQWGELQTEDYKRVGLQAFEGGVSVSTVWLGLDHGGSRNAPLIFETMIFGPEGYPYNECLMRYAVEAEAVMGHRRTCHDIEHGNRPWFLTPVEGN
jgi:hypothetical protein